MTAIAACRTCGTEPLENARFCHSCGSPVDDGDTRAEYKQVTVLFADVVHSMDIAATVGTERLREIMAELVERSAAVVKRYGGTVDKFTGDGIMAVFGAPVALEDHAIRACLAALGIQDENTRLAAEVKDRDEIDLQLRVGLNSGQVIAGVEKLLEDAQIKISSVLSDIHGVSGRAMMEALIAGQRDPWSLARLAKGNAGKKTDRLEEALRGFFTDHHATILQMMLDNIDRIGAQIAALDARIAETIGPFSRQAAQLADIPGVNTVAAAELIAEIGVDMARFPTAAHLVSWAKFCPQIHQSAGKSRSKSRGKGNPWLAGTLGRIVFSATRTDTFLGARYRRLARRRGKPKAIVAVGNSVLTVVYHLLSDTDLSFCELGPAHYESRINKHRRARDLATQLQALTGQHIVIRDGKAIITDAAA